MKAFLPFNEESRRKIKILERDMKKYFKATLLGSALAVSAAVVSASADTIKIGFNVPSLDLPLRMANLPYMELSLL